MLGVLLLKYWLRLFLGNDSILLLLQLLWLLLRTTCWLLVLLILLQRQHHLLFLLKLRCLWRWLLVIVVIMLRRRQIYVAYFNTIIIIIWVALFYNFDFNFDALLVILAFLSRALPSLFGTSLKFAELLLVFLLKEGMDAWKLVWWSHVDWADLLSTIICSSPCSHHQRCSISIIWRGESAIDLHGRVGTPHTAGVLLVVWIHC